MLGQGHENAQIACGSLGELAWSQLGLIDEKANALGKRKQSGNQGTAFFIGLWGQLKCIQAIDAHLNLAGC